MTRQVLAVIGTTFFCVGGSGIIVGLAWLTTSKLNGTLLPHILDERGEALLYTLPALLLLLATVGVGFLAASLSTPPKEERRIRHLRLHTRFHA